MRRSLLLLALPFLWLTTCGFIPIAFIAAAAAFGGGMAASGDGYTRPKPFVPPSAIVFAKAVDRTSLAMQPVILEPEERRRVLARMRNGFEPEGGLYAVAAYDDGRWIWVNPRDIIWE